MSNEDIIREKEQAKLAAYALNLCTVSVSQILDYNDPVIMDQEYDAILNNLNLQNIPKEEEALLEILEKILDTITFFRINEKEKEFVEREYQEKMKNAIWDAVPNFGMIVAGEPWTMIMSLATQVGIGYMNYRREKVRKNLEYDREMWQLERSAIEQINGLRRQLFDAAWKMSKTYNFEDEFRLTERQIKQYNEILIDEDDARKYERLNSIKGNFEAYPSFWYYLANSANMMYQKYIKADSEGVKNIALEYREKACEAYEKYLEISSRDKAILREEPIKSACCLEYIDLLDENNQDEKNHIMSLIDMAIKASGGRYDILQLAVFSYLKIGETEVVKEKLLQLINEGYNAVTNAQLLSRIYVSDYIDYKNKNNDEECQKAESLYTVLATRVNDSYLFPWPEDSGIETAKLRVKYENTQKQILIRNYLYAFKDYFEKCSIEFNRLIPVYSDMYEITDELYSNDSAYVKARLKHAEKRYREDKSGFEMDLLESEFWNGYLRLFDKIANDINDLSCISNINGAVSKTIDELEKHKQTFVELKKDLHDGESNFGTYKAVASIDFFVYFNSFIAAVCKQTVDYIKYLPSIKKDKNDITVQTVEGELRSFCIKHGLESPEEIFEKNIIEKEKRPDLIYFNEDMLGGTDENVIREMQLLKEMQAEVVKYKGELLKESKKHKVNIISRDEGAFKSYFRKVKDHDRLERNGLLIIDDKTISDRDIVLAVDGIYAVVEGHIVAKTNYGDDRVGTKLDDDKLWINKISKPVISGKDVAIAAGLAIAGGASGVVAAYTATGVVRMFTGDYYSNKEVNIKKLYDLFIELNKISDKYSKEKSSVENIDIEAFFESTYKEIDTKVPAICDNQLFNSIMTYGDSVFLVDSSSSSNSSLKGTMKKGQFDKGQNVILVSSSATYLAEIKSTWGKELRYDANFDNDAIISFYHYVNELDIVAIMKVGNPNRLTEFLKETGLYEPIELGDSM